MLVPIRGRASPQDLFGYGARTPGMGMTGVSHASDYEAVFANPAGLARARTRYIAAGLTGGGYRLSVDGHRHRLDSSRGMTIGFQLPLPFGGPLEDRIVVGAGFYTPAEVLQEANVVFPDIPQFPVLDRGQVVGIQFGVGVDLHGLIDGLRLGVGVSVLADTHGDLNVVLDETNTFRSTTETELLAGYSPIVGATYDVGDWAFGLVYRHRLQARMELAVTTAGLPVELPQLVVGGLVQYDPPTLEAEASWQPTPDWLVALGLRTSFWSDWPGMQIRTSTGSNLAPAPELKTVVSPRVAVERRLGRDASEFWLRGGYVFQPTPAPGARVAPNRPVDPDAEADDVAVRMLDNHRHIFTAGIGFAAPIGDGKRLRFDVFGQLHWLQPRTHGIPARGSPGDPDFADAPGMTSGGTILMGGWTGGLEF